MSENIKSEYSSPSWNEIFQEIGKQLHLRSGLLAKRVLLISAPALIVLFVIQLLARLFQVSQWFNQPDEAFIQFSIQAILWGSIAVVVVLFVTIILMSILKIEQAIWLDSYFDGRKLTPQESWRIAKKLYWSWSYLQFKIFYRYYLWIWLSVLGTFSLWVYLFIFSDFSKSASAELIGISSVVFIIGLGVAFIVWNRYFKIKLSYVPFLFLDRYDGEKVHSSKFWNEFFDELRELNRVSEGESFKKNVIIEISGDVAMTFVEHIAAQMQIGFELASRMLPPIAGAVVGAAGITATRAAAEVAHRVIFFAKLTGRYVLYYYAFQNIHGTPRHVNEYVYSLKN